VLISNAEIFTVSDKGLIEKGWILINDGEIEAVCEGVPPKYDGEIFAADGLFAMPGIIDAAWTRMEEDSLGFEGNDLNEMTDPITPPLRAIDEATGSIEAGELADILLFDCDPFAIGVNPKAVFICGERVK